MAQLSFTDYLRGIRKTAADVVTGKAPSITQPAGRALNPMNIRQNFAQFQRGRQTGNIGDMVQGGASTATNVLTGILAARAARPFIAAARGAGVVAGRPAIGASPAATVTRGPIERYFLAPGGTPAATAPAASSFLSNARNVASTAASAYSRLPSSVRRTATGASVAGSLAPTIYEAFSDKEAPRALDALSVLASLGLGGAGVRSLAKSRTATGAFAKGKEIVKGLFGVSSVPVAATNLVTPTPAEATPAIEVVQAPGATPGGATAPVTTRLEEIQRIQEQGLAELEASLAQEDADLDKARSEAIAAAIAAAAPAGPADLSTDPLLAAELQSIDQQYQASKQQIANDYTAALSTVGQYQAQSDQLMRDLAAQQLAGIQTAAGQAMAPVGGLTPEQAGELGVSQTALGGAGVTGAVNLGALGGVGAAQLAAERVAAAGTLGEQLATGRLQQAAQEAALARSVAEAQRGVRRVAAERAVAAAQQTRQARMEQTNLALADIEARRGEAVSRRTAIAEAKRQNNRDLVDMLSRMSNEEYNAMRSGVGASLPEWTYSRLPVPAEELGGGSGPAGITGAPSLTVNDVNDIMATIQAYAADIKARGMDKGAAVVFLTNGLADLAKTNNLDRPALDAVLATFKLPTSREGLAQKIIAG